MVRRRKIVWNRSDGKDKFSSKNKQAQDIIKVCFHPPEGKAKESPAISLTDYTLEDIVTFLRSNKNTAHLDPTIWKEQSFRSFIKREVDQLRITNNNKQAKKIYGSSPTADRDTPSATPVGQRTTSTTNIPTATATPVAPSTPTHSATSTHAAAAAKHQPTMGKDNDINAQFAGLEVDNEIIDDETTVVVAYEGELRRAKVWQDIVRKCTFMHYDKETGETVKVALILAQASSGLDSDKGGDLLETAVEQGGDHVVMIKKTNGFMENAGDRFFDDLKGKRERDITGRDASGKQVTIKTTEEIRFFDKSSGTVNGMRLACEEQKGDIYVMRVKAPEGMILEEQGFYSVLTDLGQIPSEGSLNFDHDLVARAKDEAARLAIRENIGHHKILFFFGVEAGKIKSKSNMQNFGRMGKSPTANATNGLGADQFSPDTFGSPRGTKRPARGRG